MKSFYSTLLMVFVLTQQVLAFTPIPVMQQRQLQQVCLRAEAETPGETTITTPTPSQPVKCPDCDMCDGSGRILGGIAVLLPWWPIKAYRPCPNFIDRGGIYERSGQGLDEIAFGRDSTFNK